MTHAFLEWGIDSVLEGTVLRILKKRSKEQLVASLQNFYVYCRRKRLDKKMYANTDTFRYIKDGRVFFDRIIGYINLQKYLHSLEVYGHNQNVFRRVRSVIKTLWINSFITKKAREFYVHRNCEIAMYKLKNNCVNSKWRQMKENFDSLRIHKDFWKFKVFNAFNKIRYYMIRKKKKNHFLERATWFSHKYLLLPRFFKNFRRIMRARKAQR